LTYFYPVFKTRHLRPHVSCLQHAWQVSGRLTIQKCVKRQL